MKKTIDRLLLAAGLVLAVTGLWWMWSGWDIVRDERGMAAFISGAVMLSGGLIVASVAWAVMRLLPGVPAAAKPARANAVDEAEAAVGSEPDRGMASTGVAAAAAVAVAGAVVAAHTIGSEKQEASPDDDSPEGTTRHGEIASPDDVAPDLKPEPEPAEARPPEPLFRRPSIDDLVRRSVAEESDEPPPIKPEPLFPRFDRLREEPRADVSGPDVEDRQEEAAELDDVDEDGLSPVAPLGPIFPTARPRKEEGPTVESFSETLELPEKSLAAAPADDEARIETPAAETSDEGDWFDQAERSLERALGRGSPPSESEEVASAEPEPAKAPPAVTGRYSSGDTHYTMYDDGSIEAQTPDGVMRFASLIELRRFVEQRT